MATQLYSLTDLEKALRATKPYLLDFEDKVKDMMNGIVSLEVRIHKGKATDYVVSISERTVLQ